MVSQVIELKSSSQLNDPDTPPGSVSRREVVDLGDFIGIMRDGGGVGLNSDGRRQAPEMRFCLGPVVEPKHALDDVRIFGRRVDGADTAAEISLGVAVLLQFHVEGFLPIAYGSRQHYGPARELSAGFP